MICKSAPGTTPVCKETIAEVHGLHPKLKMVFYSVYHERCSTKINLYVGIGAYKWSKCTRNATIYQTPKFLDDNDKIPLTLTSGVVEELIYAADDLPLEFMLVVLNCPVIRIVLHVDDILHYQGHGANFIQNPN